MKKNIFDNLDLPDEVKDESAVVDVSRKAGTSGIPVSAIEEAEPAPVSSENGETDEVEEMLAKHFSVIQKVELLKSRLDEVDQELSKLNSDLLDFTSKHTYLSNGTAKLTEILGNTVGNYLVTKKQITDFETFFINHFNDQLKNTVQRNLQDAIWDMKHIRQEQVSEFSSTLRGGVWFSTKYGVILMVIIFVTYFIMGLYVYLK